MLLPHPPLSDLMIEKGKESIFRDLRGLISLYSLPTSNPSLEKESYSGKPLKLTNGKDSVTGNGEHAY